MLERERERERERGGALLQLLFCGCLGSGPLPYDAVKWSVIGLSERESGRETERAIAALNNLTIIGLLIFVVLSYFCVSYAWFQPVNVVFPCHFHLYLTIMCMFSKERNWHV